VPEAERSNAATPEVSPQFFSRTISLDGPVPGDDVDRLMEALPPSVVRVKGWLRLSERPEQLMLLQRAGSQWTLVRAEGELDEQVVFIATDEAALARLAL
jgi:G3E family GTPase